MTAEQVLASSVRHWESHRSHAVDKRRALGKPDAF
jgi:hypothetical protein